MSDIATLESTTTSAKHPTESIKDNSPKLTWQQVRSILKYGTVSSKDAMATAIATNNERTDSHVNCSICLEPYHSTNVEGQIEKPALVACGHIFGNICIERWLARPMDHVLPTCPICRFTLQFKTCHHAIAAVDLYSVTHAPPPALKSDFSDVPASCSECGLRGLPLKRQYAAKLHQKAEYIAEIRNCDVQMVALLEVKSTVVKIVAKVKRDLESWKHNKAQYEGALQGVETYLLIQVEKVKQEEELFLRRFEETPTWHRKVESEKWAVPHGERAIGRWSPGPDSDYGDDEYYDREEEDLDLDDAEGGSLHSMDLEDENGGNLAGIEDLGDAEGGNHSMESPEREGRTNAENWDREVLDFATVAVNNLAGIEDVVSVGSDDKDPLILSDSVAPRSPSYNEGW